MDTDKFERSVNGVLAKYEDTPLRARWEEATSFGERAEALAFWIRDSEDVVNIVWLCLDGIRDITWLPQLNHSIFNFLPLPSIVTIEVREGAGIAKALGYDVNGDFIVRVFHTMKEATLGWIAETTKQKRDLRAFLSNVFTSYLNASR